jgi:hypothetical protein
MVIYVAEQYIMSSDGYNKNVPNTEAATTLFKYFHWQRFSNTGTVN